MLSIRPFFSKSCKYEIIIFNKINILVFERQVEIYYFYRTISDINKFHLSTRFACEN